MQLLSGEEAVAAAAAAGQPIVAWYLVEVKSELKSEIRILNISRLNLV